MIKGGAVYYATTSDGWELAIKRYKPRGRVADYPVVLCHGLMANRYSVDFGESKSEREKYSLAYYLYRGGRGGLKFDVWVPELRGRNGSRTFDPDEHPEKYNWCVDDYIDKDVPAIINKVQEVYCEERGEKTSIFWIGKSMGGMIAYAYGESETGHKNFKGVVTMGSPVYFEKTQLWRKVLSLVSPRKMGGAINLVQILESIGRIGILKKSIANKSNIDERILDRYVKEGLNNKISFKVLEQFESFQRHQNFCRYPSRPWIYDMFGELPLIGEYFSPHSYTKNIDKFVSPLLAIAGGGDTLAPPEEVRHVACSVGSSDVSFHEFSKRAGYSADYSHLDLNLGKNASKEVYPVIYEWLRERAE
jgi:pimeloyl-ACP methyl ester carboxylesterase